QYDGMKKLTVRCSNEEYETLLKYCEETDRTQNDVLREMIRKLKKSRARSTGL
ncbi:ribbon-helix-helix protein, CopG family, partial [Tolypothrix sp. PCC 7601]